MNKFLITGRAGSGKSAVNSELQQRNLNSMDTDKIPGLARWEDLEGQPVHVDPSQYVDYGRVAWNWNPGVLKSLLTTRELLYLCGSASNDLKFVRLFDRVFVLTVPTEVKLERLRGRASDYGKDPGQQAEIIQEQADFVKAVTQLGGIAIDNNRPIQQVVDEIIGATND